MAVEITVISSITAKLMVLIDLISDGFMMASGRIADPACYTEVDVTVIECGQQMGEDVSTMLHFFTTWVFPAMVDISQGLALAQTAS